MTTGMILRQTFLGLIGLVLLASHAGAAELPQIAVVATGGTIAMKLDPKTRACAGAFGGGSRLSRTEAEGHRYHPGHRVQQRAERLHGTGSLAGPVAQTRRNSG